MGCENGEDGWALERVVRREEAGLEVFRRYSREQIPRALGEQFNPAIWNAGFVPVPTGAVKHLCLLATLHKGDMAKEFQYGDRFLSPDQFQWQSQNRTKQGSSHGRMIRDHAELGIQVHLFVRKEKKRGSMAAPFVYCGPVTFEAWEGESPITVRWRLQGPVLERLYSEFKATG